MAKKTEEDIDEDFIIASMNMTGPSASNKLSPVNKSQEKEEVEDHQEKQNRSATAKEDKESKKRKSNGYNKT